MSCAVSSIHIYRTMSSVRGGETQFATLARNLALTAADFVVV